MKINYYSSLNTKYIDRSYPWICETSDIYKIAQLKYTMKGMNLKIFKK